ncbi:MAG TPA: TIM barrel protein [Blastocatellia bacterium]|nr:TIM barrel protein [Blastocatellia bacterium]
MIRNALSMIFPVLALIGGASAQSLHANDGTNEPPRLLLTQAMWGMINLPAKDREWSLEEKLRLIKEAGFDAVDTGVPKTPEEEQKWLALLDKYGLRIGLQTYPNKVEDLTAPLAAVKRMKAAYLDAHVGNYFVPEQEAAALLRALSERCKREGVAMMAQTHRGRVTQDLLRTVAYTKAIPDLRFCLDLSHYVVAGEMGGKLSPQAEEAFDALLRRAPMLDGRISNGQQVQIDVGPKAESNYAKTYAQLWKRAMVYWLKSAKPGDLFVFRVELGPPSYSILDLQGKEISNRWEQALALRALAETIWNEAVQETGIGARHMKAAAKN